MGSIAEIRIPSELAYGKKGIPRISALSKPAFVSRHSMSLWVELIFHACSPGIVPPDCELIFEVHILEVDGIPCAKDQCDRLPPAVTEIGPNDFHHPWWLARVESLGICVSCHGICHLGYLGSVSSARYWYGRDIARQPVSETGENIGNHWNMFTAVH